MKDRVIKRTNTNKDKTVDNNCLIRGVLFKDELTPKEREELELMIALPNT